MEYLTWKVKERLPADPVGPRNRTATMLLLLLEMITRSFEDGGKPLQVTLSQLPILGREVLMLHVNDLGGRDGGGEWFGCRKNEVRLILWIRPYPASEHWIIPELRS